MSPEIIDLSHTLSSSISVYPGTDKPVIKSIATFEPDGYREKKLVLSTHHGTHIDCPIHLLTKGFNTATASLSQFYGTGQVIDLRPYNPSERIALEVLSRREKEINDADFLLFCTGMDKYWNTPLYEGLFHVLSSAAAEYLARFPLKGIGIDTLSVDPVNDNALINHKIFLSHNIIIIENLNGLDQLIGKKFRFNCFPLKIEEGDGSPVRACAILEGFES